MKVLIESDDGWQRLVWSWAYNRRAQLRVVEPIDPSLKSDEIGIIEALVDMGYGDPVIPQNVLIRFKPELISRMEGTLEVPPYLRRPTKAALAALFEQVRCLASAYVRFVNMTDRFEGGGLRTSTKLEGETQPSLYPNGLMERMSRRGDVGSEEIEEENDP